jgi:hypothetical protein
VMTTAAGLSSMYEHAGQPPDAVPPAFVAPPNLRNSS